MNPLIEEQQKKNIAAKSPCICGNLRRAGRLVTKIYDTHLQPIGIKVTQYTLLLAVQRIGPVTITKLADEVILERTACTRNLKVLEGKNLIRFQQGPDKRMKHIALTAKGVDKIKEASPLWGQAQNFIFREVGEAQSLELLDELTRIISLLRPE